VNDWRSIALDAFSEIEREFQLSSTKSSDVAVIADRTAYDVGILANYQTGFGYKFTNGW